MHRFMQTFGVIFFVTSSSWAQELDPAPDLVVLAEKIWTGDPGQPWVGGFAVREGTIVAYGSRSEMEDSIGPETRILAPTSGMVLPGFTDAHVHLQWGGQSLRSVALDQVDSISELRLRVRDFLRTQRPKGWVIGAGWDHTRWGGDLPHHRDLDSVTSSQPTVLSRLDGHMVLANAAALKASGIDSTTPDPVGGTIHRDAEGRPTGILVDNAMGLLKIPESSRDSQLADLHVAFRYLAERGITTVHDMGRSVEELELLEEMRKRGELTVRVRPAVPLDQWESLREHQDFYGGGDEWIATGLLKGFADGSLGSRTAWMLEPYHDAPGERGLEVTSQEELRLDIRGATEAGLQVAIHAIGDAANRRVLDLYEEALDLESEHFFRIEHAQHLAAEDLPRFAELGVVASVQPIHLADDGRWAKDRIGEERMPGSYAWRSLLDQGVLLAGGSDWPVASASPMRALHAAVTRQTNDGSHPEGWESQQAMTLEEALQAFTFGGPQSIGEETRFGRLAPGFAADFVFLNEDLFQLKGRNIKEVEVMLTAVDGEVVFQKNQTSSQFIKGLKGAYDHVLLVSVDGVRGDALQALKPNQIPGWTRLMSGAGTLNARTDPVKTVTLPNHVGMLTGRLFAGYSGHTWEVNTTPEKEHTLEIQKGQPIAGIFAIARHAGVHTGMAAAKEKFILFPRSWNQGREELEWFHWVKPALDNWSEIWKHLEGWEKEKTLQFWHLREPDTVGHAEGWIVEEGSKYLESLMTVDQAFQKMFKDLDSNPRLKARTVIVVTSDHGGGVPLKTHHGAGEHLCNTQIPFLVWTGNRRAQGDLFQLNPQRMDPGDEFYGPEHSLPTIRNVDMGNLALYLLGLPPVPRSTENFVQDLRVSKK